MKKNNATVPKKLSVKDFEIRAEQHLADLAGMAMFADISEKDIAARKSRAEYDYEFFCKTYAPHVVTEEDSEAHRSYDAEIEEKGSPLAVTGFRGFGKTTRTDLHILRWLLFRKIKYFVLAMESEDEAEISTQDLKIELAYNERIKHDFGLICNPDAANANFTCFDPETRKTTTRVRAVGIKKGFRGMKSAQSRPDLIIFRDVQGRESAESPARTKKILRILINDAYPALNDPDTSRFIVEGNIICLGSMMDELLHEKKFLRFRKKRYAAEYQDEQGRRTALWPAKFPLEKLDTIRETIGDEAYEVEYLCLAVEIGHIFKEARDWHQYASLPADLVLDECDLVLQMDQAESGFSDFTFIGIGLSYSHGPERSDWQKWCDHRGKIFGEGFHTLILEVFCRQVGIDESIEQAVEMADRWKAQEGPDIIQHWDGSVDKEIIFERFLASWERQNNRTLPVVFDKFTVKKESRIKALQPKLQRRKFLFPPGESPDLLEVKKQLLRFGSTAQYADDAPDGLAALEDNVSPDGGNNTTEVTILG